jgi:hypothetical protein
VTLRGLKKTFADTFLLNYSLIEAAKAAGAPVGKERSHALKILSDPQVALYLTRAIAETETGLRPTQMRVLDEMNAIAFSDPGRMLEFFTDGEQAGELRRVRLDRIDPRAIQEFTVNHRKFGTDVRVKFHPKVDTLKQLGQANGLLADEGSPPRRVNIVFNGPTQINAGPGGGR